MLITTTHLGVIVASSVVKLAQKGQRLMPAPIFKNFFCLFKVTFLHPKGLEKILREPHGQTGNKPTPDIHIGGSGQDTEDIKCQIHVIWSEHADDAPCLSPKYRNGGQTTTKLPKHMHKILTKLLPYNYRMSNITWKIIKFSTVAKNVTFPKWLKFKEAVWFSLICHLVAWKFA